MPNKPQLGGPRMMGGYLVDIPLPHTRRYPSELGERQRVTVHFSTWVGSGLGATHYYGRVEEEDNPIWNSERELWQKPWDDKEYIGQHFSISADTPTEAIEEVKKIVAEHFSDETLYEVDWSELDYFLEDWIPKNTHHLYKREGD